ncbi:MAG: hypothetical protein GX625_02135 [Clostridiaceae bacterium]|nr:hypothetical protein [Clostridiaceae bacterium]
MLVKNKLILKYVGIFWGLFFTIFYVNCAFTLDEKTLDKIIANEILTVESNIQSIKGQKLIYENDFVIIQFNVKDAKEELRPLIEYSKAYETIMKILESEDKTDFHINDFPNELGRLQKIIAALMENGEFILIEKKKNKPVNKIIIKYYSLSKGPLHGEGGRKFYLPNGLLFMHILDYIS